MRYTCIDEYLLSKAGVTKDLQKDWNWIRYQVGGKMFVAVCLVWETINVNIKMYIFDHLRMYNFAKSSRVLI